MTTIIPGDVVKGIYESRKGWLSIDEGAVERIFRSVNWITREAIIEHREYYKYEYTRYVPTVEYDGMTRITGPDIVKAVTETRGTYRSVYRTFALSALSEIGFRVDKEFALYVLDCLRNYAESHLKGRVKVSKACLKRLQTQFVACSNA